MLHLCVLVSVCIAGGFAITQDELAQFYDVTIEDAGTFVRVVTDNMPGHEVGEFPGVGNPNEIKPQNFRWELFKNPTLADEVSCMPNGPIAVTKGGVAMFNPWTIDGLDAVVHERFDDCNGHPDVQGVYHYHQNPECLLGGKPGNLIGAAFDGYPIYSHVDDDGSIITPDDLDECNGRYVNGMYRYHVTLEYPYIMGCFKGEPNDHIKQRQSSPSCRIALADRTHRDHHKADLRDDLRDAYVGYLNGTPGLSGGSFIATMLVGFVAFTVARRI